MTWDWWMALERSRFNLFWTVRLYETHCFTGIGIKLPLFILLFIKVTRYLFVILTHRYGCKVIFMLLNSDLILQICKLVIG